MRQRRLIGAAVAALGSLAILGATPAHSATLCEPLEASWVKRELLEIPELSDVGARGRLPKSRRLAIKQLGAHNKLVVEGGPVGYAFATRSGRLTLGWRVGIRLVRYRPELLGDKEKTVASSRRPIGTVTAGRSRRIGVRVPPQRGLFRVDLFIRSRQGKLLGRFGRYLIGVARTLHVRLDTDRPAYSPGEEVRTEIENVGTQGIGFDANLAIEREVDGRWVRFARVRPRGKAGEILEGGQIGACARFRLPHDAPPGPYRAVRSIEVGRSGVETTLAVPFTVE